MFIFLFIWFAISGKILSFFAFILALLIHEFGHYIFAKKLGYRMSSFRLMPFGAELNCENRFFESRDEVLIATAGPLFNIVSSVLLVSLWWIFPSLYFFTYEIVFESMILALINLLPAYPLDGGRIVLGLASGKFDRNKCLKVLKISNVIFVVLFIVAFIITCFVSYNPTLILMAVFLLSGLVDIRKESRYELVGLAPKAAKNFSKVEIRTLDDEVTLLSVIKTISPRKKTIFLCLASNKLIPEDTFVKLSLIYPMDTKIEKIINKNNSTK